MAIIPVYLFTGEFLFPLLINLDAICPSDTYLCINEETLHNERIFTCEFRNVDPNKCYLNVKLSGSVFSKETAIQITEEGGHKQTW